MGTTSDLSPDAGLCAGAIGLVVANHLSPSFLPGGHFGVDALFVCAGAILARARGPWVPTWSRLLRASLPAYLACLVLTLVASSMLLVDTSFTFRTGVAAAFGVANAYLHYADAPVLGAHALANPLTHLWAVGVGVQSALMVSVLLRWGQGRARPWLPLAIATGVSAITFLTLVPTARLAVFYLAPLRLWEMGVGALVCLLAPRIRPAWGWVAAVVVAAAVAHPQGVGPWSRVAVVAGVALLRVATRGWSHPVAEALGKRSFAAYLWHWPVIVLVTQTIDLTPVHGVACVVVIAVLAEGTHRLTSRGRVRPRMAVTMIGGPAVVTMMVALMSRWPLFVGDSPPHLWWYDDEACFSDHFDPELHRACLAPAEDGARRVFVVGDSHARMHLPAIRAASPDAQVLFLALGNGCGVLPPDVVLPAAEAMTHCRDFNAAVLSLLEEHARPSDLVIVGSYHGYIRTDAASRATASHLQQLAEVVRPTTVVLLGDTPGLPAMTTGLSCQSHPWNRDRPRRCEFDRGESVSRQRHHDAALRRAAHAPNVRHLPLHDLLCEGDRCSAYRDGVLLYLDSDHLTIEGSLLLTEPLRRFLYADRTPRPSPRGHLGALGMP